MGKGPGKDPGRDPDEIITKGTGTDDCSEKAEKIMKTYEEFSRRIEEKFQIARFENPKSDIAEAFNKGLLTMKNYAHSVFLEMENSEIIVDVSPVKDQKEAEDHE